jgi:hypothetical protein
VTTYHVDPHYPEKLRCEGCGAVVTDLAGGPVPDADELSGLSPERAARCWPQHAAVVLAHELDCPVRKTSFRPGGVRVRVYLPHDGEG